MTAAEAVFEWLAAGASGREVTSYPERLKKTWVWDELYRVRNIRLRVLQPAEVADARSRV